jgi:predicted AAA+ superfamily ATPase
MPPNIINPEIVRRLDLRPILAQRSCFLFGPRQTGKTTLIRQQFAGHRVYDLLDQTLYVQLSRNPARIREELTADTEIVIIDEIQRLPELLNEVHLMIEQAGVRFLLTGSSARNLRRKGTNLLGGRARSRTLHPFVRVELGEHFALDRALEHGLLPPIYFSDAPREDLDAYTGSYLTEEIAAEAVVRNVGAFSRFLEVAALAHGTMVNYAAIANDSQVPASTVREYYQILKDTFLAQEVPAFTETRKRKAISTSKYYLFDVGVARHLQGRTGLAPGTPEYGNAFESYLFQEIKAYCDERLIDPPRYWRSKSQFEVDFLFADRAVEVKASRTVDARNLRGLKALREEQFLQRYQLVCMEPRPRVVDGIEIVPWEAFLDELWESAHLHPSV